MPGNCEGWLNENSLARFVVEIMEQLDTSTIELYKERAATAECVNAIARNRGLHQFTARSLKKVKVAILWFVFAHNFMRDVELRPVAA